MVTNLGETVSSSLLQPGLEGLGVFPRAHCKCVVCCICRESLIRRHKLLQQHPTAPGKIGIAALS